MIYTYSQLGHYGALGNQLFQIAGVVGKALSRNGVIRFRDDWFYRPYFSVPDALFGDIDTMAEVDDSYPDYLQDLRHFDYYSRIIRSYFAPSEWAASQLPEVEEDTIAVHVRRANNLKLPNHHPVPTLAYFENALATMRVSDASKLYVFSDDIDWCKQQSIFSGARFADGIPKGVEVMQLTAADPAPLHEAAIDLLTMAQCSRHIISNSTFSWWSAYLSDAKEVCIPTQWYGPALSHVDISNMFPSHWEKVNV